MGVGENHGCRLRRGVGLALGSGAARGLAHIGVLKVLEREGIPIRALSGASMGALVGGLYAAGMPLAEMEKHALAVTKRSVLAWIDPIPPRQGFIVGKRIQDLLRSFIGNVRFSELKIPLAVVAADVLTGEETILRDGDVVDAIRASISIPVVFVPVQLGGRMLVDGGVVNPVPVDQIRVLDRSAVAVAVSVLPKLERKHVEKPRTADIVLNTLDIMQMRLFEFRRGEAEVVIEPDVSFATGIEFWEARELIARGEQAAIEALPSIRKALGRWPR
ncbi:MAG: patatin-like phospholipase family protein [Firmicutes bacterium]|jgi:NTE family protein|nr:patatin-like phospholipase family protein [Bacillota bacterium]MDH7495116.1 patatin-like phospholipase family protein [Bacillota bacterium]